MPRPWIVFLEGCARITFFVTGASPRTTKLLLPPSASPVAALNKHPVSVARIVQQWFSQLALQPWNVSACVPLASIEANLSLRVLKAQTGVGAPMRKFLTDQLKDRDDDNNAPSRVRLSVSDARARAAIALAVSRRATTVVYPASRFPCLVELERAGHG